MVKVNRNLREDYKAEIIDILKYLSEGEIRCVYVFLSTLFSEKEASGERKDQNIV